MQSDKQSRPETRPRRRFQQQADYIHWLADELRRASGQQIEV